MNISLFGLGSSRVFVLSSLFILFIITVVISIFSTFIYNNSRIQLVQSLYLQAQSINKTFPSIHSNEHNLDSLVKDYAVSDDNGNLLRITLIDENWNVIADSALNSQLLESLELHSPENRLEIKNALLSTYGYASRQSETTGSDLIYVAILREPSNPKEGIIRVAFPLDINSSFYNFFVYPFFIILILVIATSTFLSLNVENNFRKDLSQLYKNTQRALKGKKLKTQGSSNIQVETISKTVEEISERLSNEIENTINQRLNFNSVLDSISQGVIIFNDNLEITFANDIALDIFGKHEFFLKEKISSKKLLPINKLLKKAIKLNQSSTEFDLNVSKQKKFFQLSASKIGTTSDLVLIINDITSLKLVEERRKNLLSDISHEIKTPVSVIRAGAETLQNGAITDKNAASRFLEAINSNSERLAEMVDDLLELEKIELGQLFLKKEPIHLKKEINLIIDSISTLADEKAITFQNNIDDKLIIKNDRQALRDVYLNLLNNAVKYSMNNGIISISSSLEKNKCIISLTDYGYGIEKPNIKRIFDRFYRTPKARAHTKGTGLGLSLVKQLLTQMGGSISVKSKIGEGSTFFVSFPIKS